MSSLALFVYILTVCCFVSGSCKHLMQQDLNKLTFSSKVSGVGVKSILPTNLQSVSSRLTRAGETQVLGEDDTSLLDSLKDSSDLTTGRMPRYVNLQQPCNSRKAKHITTDASANNITTTTTTTDGQKTSLSNVVEAHNIITSSIATNKDKTSPVCLTAGCVKAAADILRNMDEKVSPCDDFYSYACGNWIESQSIPEDKTSVSMFSLIQDELDKKLRTLVEREPRIGETPIVTKMRNLYESCMNTSKY